MVSATFGQEFELDYAVSYREVASPTTIRDMCSQERFHTEARHSRGGKRQGPASAAHRRGGRSR